MKPSKPKPRKMGRPRSVHPDRPSTSAERAQRAVQAVKDAGGTRKTLALPSAPYVAAWSSLLQAHGLEHQHAHHLIFEMACLLPGAKPHHTTLAQAAEKASKDLGVDHPIAVRLGEMAKHTRH